MYLVRVRKSSDTYTTWLLWRNESVITKDCWAFRTARMSLRSSWFNNRTYPGLRGASWPSAPSLPVATIFRVCTALGRWYTAMYPLSNAFPPAVHGEVRLKEGLVGSIIVLKVSHVHVLREGLKEELHL